MSVPVSICLLSKAATSETAYQRVLSRMKFNAECCSFTLWPCTHTPRCPKPDPAATTAMLTRLKADLLKLATTVQPSSTTVNAQPSTSPS
jgi:hypothetical protein